MADVVLTIEAQRAGGTIRDVLERLPRGTDGDLDLLPLYGSCDSPEQLYQHPTFAWAESTDRPVVVTVRRLTRKDDGGWRWHKNGPYSGVHEPQMEHLGDEPVIEEVWAFGLFILGVDEP